MPRQGRACTTADTYNWWVKKEGLAGSRDGKTNKSGSERVSGSGICVRQSFDDEFMMDPRDIATLSHADEHQSSLNIAIA
jgi:hypothetical protein